MKKHINHPLKSKTLCGLAHEDVLRKNENRYRSNVRFSKEDYTSGKVCYACNNERMVLRKTEPRLTDLL